MAHILKKILAFQMFNIFQVKGNNGELFEVICQKWWFPRVVTI